jgi:hypothetical protein
LTCRANHRHNIIIARILKPAARELAAGFFQSDVARIVLLHPKIISIAAASISAARSKPN